MKTVIAALFLVPALALAQDPPVCVSQAQATELLKGVWEMSAAINQQRVEIEALKRRLAEQGIEYVPAWQRFLQQIQEAHRGK